MAEADRPDFESFRIAGIERLRVISLITKDGGFPGSWGVPIKSIKMFRSKAFSARPVYFLSIAKSRPEIAMDLCHGKKDAYMAK
jgi:hypothetical protein